MLLWATIPVLPYTSLINLPHNFPHNTVYVFKHHLPTTRDNFWKLWDMKKHNTWRGSVLLNMRFINAINHVYTHNYVSQCHSEVICYCCHCIQAKCIKKLTESDNIFSLISETTGCYTVIFRAIWETLVPVESNCGISNTSHVMHMWSN